MSSTMDAKKLQADLNSTTQKDNRNFSLPSTIDYISYTIRVKNKSVHLALIVTCLTYKILHS